MLGRVGYDAAERIGMGRTGRPADRQVRRLTWVSCLAVTVGRGRGLCCGLPAEGGHRPSRAGPGASPGGGARLARPPGAACGCDLAGRGPRVGPVGATGGDAARGRSGEHLRRRRAGHAQPGGTGRALPDLRAGQRRFHGNRHQSGHLPGDRELPDRAQPAARRARLRPAYPVRGQRPGQQPHPDQPPYRAASRPEHSGRRPVQPVLHPRRALRHRGRGGPRAPGLP